MRAELDAAPGATGLMVVLHGHSDLPDRLLSRMARLDPRRRLSWLAPYGPTLALDGPAWFPTSPVEEGPDLATALAKVDEAVDRNMAGLGIDGKRTVVVGHSQGAAAGLALACRTDPPWRPRAVIGLAGWLPHEALSNWDLEAASDTRFFLAHGADDPVIPVEMGRAAARALERAGADVTWHEHPGGHEISPAVLDVAHAWLDSALQ